MRRLWDRAAYDVIISRKGRIPCSDSLLVTRVHGPGLSSDYCLQVSCCLLSAELAVADSYTGHWAGCEVLDHIMSVLYQVFGAGVSMTLVASLYHGLVERLLMQLVITVREN